MDSRGADAPRALRIVDVDGESVGDDVTDADGAVVGKLTSVVGSLGLAYVKRGSGVGRVPDHAA